MKKYFLLLVLFLALVTPTLSARADNVRYSQITTEGVSLYIDSTLTIKWFDLPVGYCVKVLSVSHFSAKVEYKSDDPKLPSAKGYVSTEHLNVLTETPQVLFPSVTFTVNQNCLLYKDTDFTISETITQGSTVDYYGTIQKDDGKLYVYGFVKTLSGDEYVGYVPSPALSNFEIPFLPIEKEEEIVESSSESTSDAPSSVSGHGNTLQLVVIIAVSIVAISIVYLLFKPSQKKAKDEVVTESEWDDE
ncbi:MAG: hypothetical protein IJC87_01225 [Clostridia bacterium]|nr:hypothetical protein [Clostridia bacterium]